MSEVGVLQTRLRKRRRLSRPERAVEREHLLHEQADRPAVRHDVVLGDQELVIVRAQAQQPHPKYRTLLKIERPAYLLGGNPLRGRLSFGFRQTR